MRKITFNLASVAKRMSVVLAAVMISVSALAETVKINPTWEGNYRTNNATPTGWTKVTTTDAKFEVKNGARFFAVQTWTIASISKVTKLEFVYPRVSGQTNSGELAMWAFPYNSMVTSTANYSTEGVAFLNDVAAVLGVMPGNTITNAPLKASTPLDKDGGHYRIVTLGETEIAALKAAGTTTNDYLTVNVLLCTYREDANYASEMNYTFNHTGDNTSYCNVTVEGEVAAQPAIFNNTTMSGYTDLATAVAEATAGDVLTINEDVTISGNRLEIKKTLTIQGATGAEKIICGVSYNTLMVLAGDNTVDYTVTFKNLIVDGQNVERDRQLFDNNGKAKLAFDGVSVINSKYSVVTGDVKCAGSNIILSGVNSFPYGVYLNMNKRVDNQGATHTEPIKIILSADYKEDYVVVLNCTDPNHYTAVDANGNDWEFYVNSNNKELKARKVVVEDPATGIDNAAAEQKAVKVIRNGQIIILRDGIEYNVLGSQM